jgi:hypothetical protein
VRTTRVTAYDLDGRPLGPAAELRGPGGSGLRAPVRAIAVDDDRRIWAADADGTVRAHHLSGVEIDRIESAVPPDSDQPGALGDSAGLAVQGVEAETELLLSRRGHRRHALFLLTPGATGSRPRSLRPGGDPTETFRNLAGVALAGDRAYACEAGTGTIQVFRGGEFHYRIPLPREDRLEARLVAPLPDGRLVVACGGEAGGAVLVLDPGGRPLATIAAGGSAEGSVELPLGLAVEEGAPGPSTRVAVLDLGGDRVQVFTLDGRCFGSFLEPEGADPV